MTVFWNSLKRLIDPFELLYIAIAIATFTHTQWMGAFWFEGTEPTTNASLWYLRGSLLAIAIDVGMLLTSRFLQDSKDSFNSAILVFAFVIAAAGSFFTQLGYMLYHTPVYEMSVGVSSYWQGVLKPLMDARVIILPLLLPTMASVYTVARIFRHKTAIKQRIQQEQSAKIVVRSYEDLSQRVKADATLLDNPDKLQLPAGDQLIDWENLKFFDALQGRWRGPYKTKQSLVMNMKSLETRRRRKSEEQTEDVEGDENE